MNNIPILTLLIDLCYGIVGLTALAFIAVLNHAAWTLTEKRRLKRKHTKLTAPEPWPDPPEGCAPPPTKCRVEMPFVKPPRKSSFGLGLDSVAPIPRSPRRNLGRFYVSDVMVENYWESMLVVMASIVPVQVSYRYDIHAYEYIAHSALFEEVPVGMMAPLYECHFRKVPIEGGDGHTVTFEFKRITAPQYP